MKNKLFLLPLLFMLRLPAISAQDTGDSISVTEKLEWTPHR